MMGYVISIIMTVVSGVLVWILQGTLKDVKELRQKKEAEERKKDEAMTAAVLSLLRIQLIEYHDKYMMRDEIPAYVYENWDDMYKAYAALGGNGTIKRMNDDISKIRLGGEKK